MPKNQSTFSIKGQLDISDITKGLDKIREKANSSGLGNAFNKDIDALSKKFQKAFSEVPGIGATTAQMQKFAVKVYDATDDLERLEQKMRSFGITDEYIKENVFSIKNLAKSFADAQKKASALQQSVKDIEVKDVGEDVRGSKTLFRTAKTQMKNAASEGRVADVTSAYRTTDTEIDTRILAAKESGKSDYAEALLREQQQLKKEYLEFLNVAQKMEIALSDVGQAQKKLDSSTQEMRQEMDVAAKEIVSDVGDMTQTMRTYGHQVDETAETTRRLEQSQQAFDTLSNKMKSVLSAASVFQTLRHIIRGAIEDFKALDKQFNEIAIVSEYSTEQMWSSFAQVNRTAQEFGVTTENVLEVQNLYYHQGKSMAEVNKLTAQTLTLAKITGMDYEEATSNLTAALNAYNIAAEDAVRVTDTIAAMDTNAAISSEELMTALTKTASIAANAGMSLESTEVFLTKMIETTREAPENLGTALKTIIARFGEVKQEIDGQEVELADINRVDTALKSIGISLLDTAGQIRDLDGVFMELSSTWDDLDRNTQRYIATMAAGSRQQSRFIAMMEDYDRTLELTEIAQNSAGLGSTQLEKSMESLESATNRLKSSWQELYTGFISAGAFKTGLEGVNNLLSLVNELPTGLQAVTIGLTGWTAKALILDRALLKLSITHQGLLQGLTYEQILEKYNQARNVKKQSSILGQIKTILKYNTAKKLSNTIDMKTLVQESALDKAMKRKEGTIRDIVKAKLIEQGIDSDVAEEIIKTTLEKEALENLNQEIEENIALKKVSQLAQKTDGNEAKQKVLEANAWKLVNKEVDKNTKLLIANEAVEDMADADTGTDAAKKISANVAKAGSEAVKSAGGISKVFSTIGSKITAVISTITTALSGITAGAIAAAGAIAIIVAVIVALGVAAYKSWAENNKVITDNTKDLEKLREAQEDYNKSLEKMRTLENNLKTIKKYNAYTIKNTEQAEEEQTAIRSIAEEYPALLDYIDEEGNYYLKNISYLEKELELQRQITAEAGQHAAETREDLARKGIFTEDNTSVLGIETRLSGIVQELDINDKSITSQANEIRKHLGLAYDEQIDNMFEGFLEGTKTSLTTADFNAMFGIDSYFTGTDTEKFYQAAQGKNLSNYSDFYSAVKAVKGTSTSDAEIQSIYNRYIKIANSIPEISQLVTSGWGEVEAAQKEAISNAFSVADFDFEFSNEAKARFTEAFMTLQEDVSTEDIIASLQKLDKKDYDEIMNSIFNMDELSLAEIKDGKVFDDALAGIDEQTKKALEAYIISQQETIQENYDLILNTIGKKNQAIIEQLTGEQIAAMSNQIARITELRNETYAAWAYDNIIAETAAKFGKDTEKYNEAINLMNSADLSTVDGVRKLSEELLEMGYTSDEASKIIIMLSGGIENLVSESDIEQIERITKELEEFEKQIESVVNLLGKKGNFSDVMNVANLMKEQGATADELLAFYNSLSFNLTGVGGNEAQLNKLGKDYLATQKQLTQETINRLASERNTAKAAEDTEQVKEKEAQIALEQIGYEMTRLTWEKARHDETIENLEKEIELAKEFYNIYKDWDRYQNLDRKIEREKDKYDLAADEADFMLNPEAVTRARQEQYDSLNEQLALANAGKVEAELEVTSIRSDIETGKVGDYVSFDEDGVLVKNADAIGAAYEELNALKAKGDSITTADQIRIDELETELMLVEDLSQEYDDAYKSQIEYTKMARDATKDIDKLNEELNNDIIERDKLLVDIIKEHEDEQLEAMKEKFDAIKEEQDEYLDNVKKMIDKERKLREKADRKEDIKSKEKRLAMMRMDTSGVYDVQIRELEQELEQDYQDLEDELIDEQIERLEETLKTEQEGMDKLVEYTENTLEERRKDNQYYYDYIKKYADMTTDEIILDLQSKSTEYKKMTEEEKQATVNKWQEILVKGQSANEILSQEQYQKIQPALKASKETADSFEGAIEQYGETATTVHSGIETDLNTLSSNYQTLVSDIGDVNDAIASMESAYKKAEKAAEEFVKDAKEAATFDTSGSETGNPKYHYVMSGRAPGAKQTGEQYTYTDKGVETKKYYLVEDDYGNQYWTTNGEQINEEELQKDVTWSIDNRVKSWESWGTVWAPERYRATGNIINDKNGDKYYEFIYTYNGNSQKVYARHINGTGYKANQKPVFMEAMYTPRYADGGLITQTGFAYLDGSFTKPEAIINWEQMNSIVKLTDNLKTILPTTLFPNTNASQADEKLQSAVFNFHINIDQMASDYDVDKLMSKIQEKLVKTGQYRNVHTITTRK